MSPGALHTFDSRVLQGRTAVVTGASRGIGLAIAALCVEAGASRLAALSRTHTPELQALQQQAAGVGCDCRFIAVDLADEASVRKAAREILSWCDRVDIVVNNAGAARLAPLLEQSTDDWDETLRVNLRAPFLLTRELVRDGMIPHGHGGKVVHISSVAAYGGVPDHAAYCASKAALHSLTRTMAVEWGRHRIHCNAVCPTIVMTDMGRRVWGDPAKHQPVLQRIPLQRFASVEEIAHVVLFLLTPASDMLTGNVLTPDGGLTAGL
ncbi:hypothetical protein CDCA_CDCA03G0907 [Cyanidium caldarium]|uniref:Ketoreductase domain-containing protein n=1 Tax=Cyanidium caldarium TaxID=2771 RepID=A0AAV9IR97_CYACA|nr:hypothetical protein CDCA_CDCA03G0907 [Cyanidium caldarium]